MILKIVTFPDPILRKKSIPVKEIDDKIKNLIDNMIDTMFANKGLGLSAIQVGVPLRLFILDLNENKKDQETEKKKENVKVFINPVLKNLQEKFIMENEGCLSLPGVRENVERFYKATIEAIDLNGEKFVMDAEGIVAVAFQHEYDHLEGKLFIDRLSPVKRKFLLKEYKKIHNAKK